jgi:hypothetical protein
MTACSRNGAVHFDVRTAAAEYITRGLAPIPVCPRGKRPLSTNWQHLRPDAQALDQLFPPGEGRNIGLLLGEPSGGLVDVDLDAAPAVAAAKLLLPETGWVSGRPSKRESHYWFRLTEPPARAQTKFADLDGTVLVELRSTGGQTVVPPSVHETGEVVEWHRFDQPSPVGLADLEAAVAAVAAAALLANHWPEKGLRQDAYLALAGGLLRAGWDRGRVETFLDALAHAAGDEEIHKRVECVAGTEEKLRDGQPTTGWPRLTELIGADGPAVGRRVRDWLNLGPVAAQPRSGNRPRPAPAPYQPFPVDAIPQPVQDYIVQGARALGCDPAFLALPALAVLASAIGNTRVIRLKRTWTEPSIVWSAVVAESGTLKSPAFRKVVGHLFHIQTEFWADYQAKEKEYRKLLEEFRAARRRADEPEDIGGLTPEPPRARRVVCNDSTIEKLAELLEDNPRGLLVARDELAAWVGSFSRYKGSQGGTDLPNWLELFHAGFLSIDRKTGDRKTIIVPRASVSVTGGIQPATLGRVLTPSSWIRGCRPAFSWPCPRTPPKSGPRPRSTPGSSSNTRPWSDNCWPPISTSARTGAGCRTTWAWRPPPRPPGKVFTTNLPGSRRPPRARWRRR